MDVLLGLFLTCFDFGSGFGIRLLGRGWLYPGIPSGADHLRFHLVGRNAQVMRNMYGGRELSKGF